MRFLIAFLAVLGYASASLIAPLGWAHGINAGDAQAAHIDASVAAKDHARAWAESQARAAEAHIQYNNEAARQAADNSRTVHENVYWGSVAANQNAVAAAQSHAAAVSGAIAGRADHAGWGAPYVGSHLAAPYGIAGLSGLAAPYGALGLGLGHNIW